jgi:peptidyl-prolyl cis-trans isomerase B (cyclophilin B)
MPKPTAIDPQSKDPAVESSGDTTPQPQTDPTTVMDTPQNARGESPDEVKEPVMIVMEIKMGDEKGDLEIELDSEKAPLSVANFLQYVDDGFFAGTIFHRVINNFMIQGGGFTPDMEQKPTREPIENEAKNGLKNEVGTLAMARTNDLHSATSQFFINVNNNEFLNHRDSSPAGFGYAVFGKVVSGMDFVNKIKETATGNRGHYSDVPKTPVVIVSVRRK